MENVLNLDEAVDPSAVPTSVWWPKPYRHCRGAKSPSSNLPSTGWQFFNTCAGRVSGRSAAQPVGAAVEVLVDDDVEVLVEVDVVVLVEVLVDVDVELAAGHGLCN